MRKVPIPLIIALMLSALPAHAEDCCPGLRSTEGEIQLGLDHVEIALATRVEAASLWRDQLGFNIGEWAELPGGVSAMRLPLSDGSAITLVHCATALDRRSSHYEQLCSAGGGPGDVILSGTDLEYIRFALEAVEEPLEFIDGRTRIELTRPRDADRQPLRFVQHYLPDWDRPGRMLHPNEARGLSAVWLSTDNLARDLLLLELLGGTDSGDVTTGAGTANLVSLAGIDILLHPGEINGLIGLELWTMELEHCAAAMRLPGPGMESTIGGPGSRFTLTPAQTGGLWLQFVELEEAIDPGPNVARNGGQ